MTISPETKTRLISLFHTFISTFITAVAMTLSSGTVEWTASFWFAVLLAGVRAGVKELFVQFGPQSLGGKK